MPHDPHDGSSERSGPAPASGAGQDAARPPLASLSSERWHALLVEASTEGILVHEEGHILRVNDTLARMIGASPEELIGTSGFGLVVPEDRERLAQHIAARRETSWYGTGLRRDGQRIAIEVVPRTVHENDHVLRVIVVRDIEAQVQRDRELRVTQDRFQLIARAVGDAFWIVEAAPRVRVDYVSPAFETLFDMSAEEVYRDPYAFVARIHPDDRDRVRGAFSAPPTNSGLKTTEYRVVRLDGHIRWVRTRWYLVRAAEPGSLRVVGVSEDVTEQRRQADALRRSRAELAMLAEHSPDVFTRYDREHRVRFMSRAVEQATGIPAESFLGKRMSEMGVPRELTDTWDAHTDRVFATGEPTELDFEFTNPQGERHIYHTRIVPERGESGTIESVLTTTRDVTVRRRAEAAARAADATLRSLVEQSLTGIYVIQDERFAYVNPRFAQIFGFDDPAEVTALRSISEVIHPDDRETVRRNLALRVEGEVESVHYSFRALRRDGAPILVEVYGARGEHEGRPAVVGTLLDVTEHARAIAALQASEARFRALVEHGSDLVAILDADARVRYASPSIGALTGIEPAALAGRRVYDFVHPDDAARLHATVDAAQRSAEPTSPEQFRFRSHDGSYCTVELRLRDMQSEPGVAGIVANGRDVTERIALEEQLRRAQRMEAVGQLAGGVAHDFNNILAAVSGYAQMLRGAIARDDPRFGDADEIVKATMRGAAITRQLLAFSRRQVLETEVLDLAAVVRETGGMLRSLLPASIDLELPGPEHQRVPVRASRSQLEQIVVNLAVNARDAMPSGGRLTFEVGVRTHGEPPMAVLRAVDTGQGIPAAIRDRVFDPFFTTKPPGQGTGLGLATVYGLVRQFAGTIELQSHEGDGTTFTIALPLVAGDDAEREAPAAAPPPTRAPTSQRILLVEDEAPVRAITRRILENAGYDVVEAPNGAVAWSIAQHDPAIALVLTDASMPVLDGRALADRLRAHRPALPVILMSGYAETLGISGGDAAEQRAQRGIAAFVEKPFAADHLLRVIGGALKGKTS